MRIAIVITNPNHHFDLTRGVAQGLKESGIDVIFISLCELRRMRSPIGGFEKLKVDYHVLKSLPEQLKPDSGKKTLGSNNSFVREVLRKVYWRLKLKPFFDKGLAGVDKVLLLNDAAYPGNYICRLLRKKKLPFFLLQEGIRFPLPNEVKIPYGNNGAKKVMTWGKRSQTHFKSIVPETTEVVVTGSPRFDEFLKRVAATKQRQLSKKVLGVFTNPIDDQGFCSLEEKVQLFKNFVARVRSYLIAENIELAIKCHPREEIQQYLDVAREEDVPIRVLPDSIFEAINDVDAGVIMASTVGLELLGARKNIAQLEIPQYGYVFDYEEHADFVKIPIQGEIDLSSLFVEEIDMTYFVEHVLVSDEPSEKRIVDILLTE